jgi:hypothetical protein
MMDDLTQAEKQFDELDVSSADVEVAFFSGEIGVAAARSIQLNKLNDDGYEAPDSVYMIYMKFDTNGRFVVKQLSERPYTGTLAEAEANLLKVARGPDQPSGNILVEGSNFQGIAWRRPHYLTFVIDNPGWKIYWGLGGLDDPLRFLSSKPGSTTAYLTDNYTFFDAEPVQNLAAGDAFRCINYHHRDEFTNELLNGDTRDYCFQIYLQTPFAGPANPQSHIVLIVDPDGQNQGPRT